jgi:AbrB family looped-hinge helix DNA binding protein
MARSSALRYTGQVDQAGRVVIPVEIRGKAHLQPGATLTITAGPSGRIILEPAAAILPQAREHFLGLGPAAELWSDQVLAERRLQARPEIED